MMSVFVGNYCPMCHKCYSDDDWDCKMVQCATCDAWVHAKCEGLTDEKYQLLSYLPQDVQYNCRYCSPTRPAPWQQVIDQEMQAGFTIILRTILNSKSALFLDSVVESEVSVGVIVAPGRGMVVGGLWL